MNLLNFYENYMAKLYPLYGKIERRGIRVNLESKQRLSLEYEEKIKQEQDELDSLIGHTVNVNSNPQVMKLLYYDLKLPMRKGADENTLVMLRNNAVKDTKKKEIITRILKLRKTRKAKGTYIDCWVDFDGRIRCEWKPCGTETGRSSTSVIKSPLRNGKWGIALQTLTKYGDSGPEIRKMFIPDEGKIFIEVDKAQAESRVADVLATDYEFLIMRDTLDTHKLTAARCFSVPIETIDHDQRQVGKRAAHAYDNGVGKREFSLQITKEINKTQPGYYMSEWRAGQILANMSLFRPNIVNIFHKGIEDTLANNNNIIVVPPYGRYRQFYNKWGRDLFKEAYAHVKQSIVIDDVRRGMLHLDENYPWIDIMIESHDGLLLQCDINRKDEAKIAVKEALLQPLDFNMCSLQRDFILQIPIDIKTGFDWYNMEIEL
ncbi:MAG: DNA polymerase [Candidatus Paceibacterota bacterium]